MEQLTITQIVADELLETSRHIPEVTCHWNGVDCVTRGVIRGRGVTGSVTVRPYDHAVRVNVHIHGGHYGASTFILNDLATPDVISRTARVLLHELYEQNNWEFRALSA